MNERMKTIKATDRLTRYLLLTVMFPIMHYAFTGDFKAAFTISGLLFCALFLKNIFDNMRKVKS